MNLQALTGFLTADTDYGGPPGSSDYYGPAGRLPLYNGLTTPVTTVSNTSSIGTTGDFVNQDVNGLLQGRIWNTSTLTFSFPTAVSNYNGGGTYSDQNALSGYQVLSDVQKGVVRYALGLISQYTPLTFTEITETDSTHATLRMAGSTNSSQVPTSYGYYPFNSDTGGDIWYGNVRDYPTLKAGYAFDTVMHEIGHTLGLKHGQDDDGTHGTLPAAHNSTEWSIMDYHSYIGADSFYRNVDGSGNQTYMIDDIAALQYMYGANFTSHATNTVYTWSPTTGEMSINGVGQGASETNTIYEAIWDGNGVDTYDLSNYTTNLVVDLRPGAWSTFDPAQLAELDVSTPGIHPPGEIANAWLYNNDTRSLIENAIGGSGNDTLTGNAAANTLTGNAGDDTLDGQDGSDTASYLSAASAVTVSLAIAGAQNTLGAGTDTLISIENLTGSAFGDTLTGGSGANVLDGEGGNDTLNGGNGQDWASYADAPSAVTVSLAIAGAQNTVGAGTDTLIAIEKLEGSAFADTLTAAAAGSTLAGDAGNDLLIQGAGNDVLSGGTGTDAVSYAGATAGVHVSLLLTAAQNTLGAGTDTLTSIEKLIGSDYADTLTANATGATLNGGAGGDDLIGGPGSDILNGGAASDFADYALAAAGVTVSLAITTFQNTIGAGSDELVGIEKLVGSGFADHLTGDAGVNIIYGQGGADVINGGGGGDIIYGGAGTDSFVFSAIGDSTPAAPDTISDFAAGDHIDLHLIDANTGTAGDQAFHLGATVGHTGDIVVGAFSGGKTVLDLYVNADATVDARIWLTGDHTGIGAGDFVL